MENIKPRMLDLASKDDCFDQAVSWERLTFVVGSKVGLNGLYYTHTGLKKEMRSAGHLKGLLRMMFPEVATRLDEKPVPDSQPCKVFSAPSAVCCQYWTPKQHEQALAYWWAGRGLWAGDWQAVPNWRSKSAPPKIPINWRAVHKKRSNSTPP